MKFWSAVILCLFLISASSRLQAQSPERSLTTEGTDFWFGFMPNYTIPANYCFVYLAAANKATVTIDLYSGGNGAPIQSLKYTLAGNTAQTAELDVAKAETRTTETPAYRAIHVSSTAPIVCYGMSSESSTTDGFLAIPTHGLGKRYYTANYNDDWYSSPSEPLAGEFLIVAPYDNTNVTIRTNSETRQDQYGVAIGHEPTVPWSINLQKGQTYLVQSTGRDKANDISGSLVTSDKPIGLLSGHQRCPIPNDVAVDPGNSKDHLLEMLPPVDEWSTEAYVMPMRGRTKCGDYVRVYSGSDRNQIVIGNGPTLFLDAGEYSERAFVLSPEWYKATGPMLVEMYSYSQGVNNDPINTDPFMSTVPLRAQWSKTIRFRVPTNPHSNGDFQHYAIFTGRADSLLSTMLNGKSLQAYGAVSPSLYAGSTNPTIGSVIIQLVPGERLFTATSGSPFSISLYGSTAVDGYGMPAAMGVMLQSSDTTPPSLTESGTRCGTTFVTVKDIGSGIAAVEAVFDTLDIRGGKPASNMIFTLDPILKTGDSIAHYTIQPYDPQQDGSISIYIVDRAGNHFTKTYSYKTGFKNITLTDLAPIRFSLPFKDSCRTLRITNTTGVTETIDSLSLRSNQKSFSLGSLTITFPLKLDSGKSVDIPVCMAALDLGTYYDTLIVSHGCSTNKLIGATNVVTPQIYVHDLTFDTVAVGSTSCKMLLIDNLGALPLTVLAQDLPASNSEFSINASTKFPLVIQPRTSDSVAYCFHPTKEELAKQRVAFTTGNVTKYLHSLRDTATFTGRTAKLGVSASLMQSNGLSVLALSPNPSTGMVVIRYSMEHHVEVIADIIDERGAVVKHATAPFSEDAGTHERSFDLSGLANGTYFLRLSTNGGSTNTKFVIEH